MDLYSGERWILERHAAMIQAAEASARLGLAKAPLSGWVAAELRRLADRLDGGRAHGVTLSVVSSRRNSSTY